MMEEASPQIRRLQEGNNTLINSLQTLIQGHREAGIAPSRTVDQRIQTEQLGK